MNTNNHDNNKFLVITNPIINVAIMLMSNPITPNPLRTKDNTKKLNVVMATP